MNTANNVVSPTARKMDDIYRVQRFIYDFSRRYYLLGRLGMLRNLDAAGHVTVLEAGCGTGWNLVQASRIYPQAHFFGLDISPAMLRTARRSIDRAGQTDRIRLAAGDATCFDTEALFGVRAFDRILISYALSMIPDWQAVLHCAEQTLAKGGSIHIVDFGNCEKLPGIFRDSLWGWLSGFSVYPVTHLEKELVRFCDQHKLNLSFESLYRGYSVCAVLKR